MHVSRDFNEFRPGGKRRLELGILIFQILNNAKLSNNEELLSDLQVYLDKIQYDADQIHEERMAAVEEMMKSDLSAFVKSERIM